MIVKDSDAVVRLNSPLNLINKLRNSNSNNKRNNAMSLFGIGCKRNEENNKNGEERNKNKNETLFNPFESSKTSEAKEDSLVPTIKSSQVPSSVNSENLESVTNLDNILGNHDSQIKLGLAHDKALDLLTRSVDILTEKLDDVRADKLPAVVSSASKVVESIRRERTEASKNNKDREVHYHFYTPEQRKVSDYEVIEVASS